jgi:hypothetical protein
MKEGERKRQKDDGQEVDEPRDEEGARLGRELQSERSIGLQGKRCREGNDYNVCRTVGQLYHTSAEFRPPLPGPEGTVR